MCVFGPRLFLFFFFSVYFSESETHKNGRIFWVIFGWLSSNNWRVSTLFSSVLVIPIVCHFDEQAMKASCLLWLSFVLSSKIDRVQTLFCNEPKHDAMIRVSSSKYQFTKISCSRQHWSSFFFAGYFFGAKYHETQTLFICLCSNVIRRHYFLGTSAVFPHLFSSFSDVCVVMSSFLFKFGL